MPSFLQNLGVQAGLNINAQRDADNEQATIDLKQQQVAQMKMSTMAAQQKMQAQKDIGAFITAEQQKDKSTIDDPQKSAQVYSKASSIALQAGDFEGAAQMSSLAQGKLKEAKDNEALVTEKVALRKEALAATASDYIENPSASNSSRLVQDAVNAGQNPVDIPKPGTDAFKGWAENQRTQSMTAKERVEQTNKLAEQKQKREDSLQLHKDQEEDKRAVRAQTAAYQAGIMELRRSTAAEKADRAPQIQEFEGKKYQWDPNQRVKGNRDRPDAGWVQVAKPTVSKLQDQNTNAIVGSAAEATRGLRIIGNMAPDATSGAFMGLKSGTIPDALSKVGANRITPQSSQLYQTASAGLGLELGRVLTLGGGRGVNQAQIHELQEMTSVKPGDTEFEGMFKFANAADMVRNRLATLPDSGDEKVLKHQKETEAWLAKIPTPEEVLEVARKSGQDKNILKKYGNLQAAATAVKDGSLGDANKADAEGAALVAKYAK